ncbi:MAG: MBL fold metallo-hydrolase [Pirellulaceae bacterium]
MATIETLDLHFQGHPRVVASFLIRHAGGAVLVDCGPGSTIPALEAALSERGLSVTQVTDVLLTHIHLDHAGAAGWLARRGARIHVHPQGAAHLLNPDKLLASAARIYGEQMEPLWGSFLPVPPDRLLIPRDGEAVIVGEHQWIALDVPGHAEHHFAYLYGDACFCGDVGGIRLPGPPHVRVPMPPPEFHLEKWRASVTRLQSLGMSRIALAHFGIYDDAASHLRALSRALDEVEEFLHATMVVGPSVDELNATFLAWSADRSRGEGLSEAELASYEAANPSWMSAAGMLRYWRRREAK